MTGSKGQDGARRDPLLDAMRAWLEANCIRSEWFCSPGVVAFAVARRYPGGIGAFIRDHPIRPAASSSPLKGDNA